MKGDDLTKKAADMLLQGATLVSQPCPYCKGVRVIKDGNAMCVSCGRMPKKEIEEGAEEAPKPSDTVLQRLETKLESLSKDLETQADHQIQQDIIKSIDSLLETISKLKKQ